MYISLWSDTRGLQVVLSMNPLLFASLFIQKLGFNAVNIYSLLISQKV